MYNVYHDALDIVAVYEHMLSLIFDVFQTEKWEALCLIQRKYSIIYSIKVDVLVFKIMGGRIHLKKKLNIGSRENYKSNGLRTV